MPTSFRQFKHYAKDFGESATERLTTIARLMGSKGDAILKVGCHLSLFHPPNRALLSDATSLYPLMQPRFTL
jgi:hypothetical protein